MLMILFLNQQQTLMFSQKADQRAHKKMHVLKSPKLFSKEIFF